MRTYAVHTTTALAAASALTFAACGSTDNPTSSAAPTADSGPRTVTVVTHDSFFLPEELVANFETELGATVQFIQPGDAGTLANQLVLTAGSPLGDVVYGIDNTFATRALDADVFAEYAPTASAAADGAAWSVPNAEDLLTAIDYSDVCVNADLAYFESNELALPSGFDDLADSAYTGLLSVQNPSTSSPGLAFLLATIAAEGDDWEAFWGALTANDVRVTSSWSDSYFTDFSAPNYGGNYPLVVSYASSPPFEVIDGEPTTVALLDTCFRQVEYAGVLAGAENPDLAGEVIEWLLSDDVQAALPESMYVYPVSTSVEIPADWAAHAPLSPNPHTLDPADISANRADYIAAWTAVVLD